MNYELQIFHREADLPLPELLLLRLRLEVFDADFLPPALLVERPAPFERPPPEVLLEVVLRLPAVFLVAAFLAGAFLGAAFFEADFLGAIFLGAAFFDDVFFAAAFVRLPAFEADFF